jgi:hypothetical protein
MAPELFLTKPYLGEPVDVFAIGVTLFMMFAIDYPFENVKDGDYYKHLKNGDYPKFWEI